MREPIPLTEDMKEKLLQLRSEGVSLRSLGRHFGVSHMTIKRWLKSDTVTKFLSSTVFKRGDSAKLTRDVQSGVYCLYAGDIVIFSNFDPEANTGWVKSDRLRGDVVVDVPMDALETIHSIKQTIKLLKVIFFLAFPIY